jgi:hypothetical protein
MSLKNGVISLISRETWRTKSASGALNQFEVAFNKCTYKPVNNSALVVVAKSIMETASAWWAGNSISLQK